MNIIEVENLEKSYGKVHAVKGISFCVGKGSLFSFLGVNGAGKSTTINILCSILKKDAGKVSICGFDLAALPAGGADFPGHRPQLRNRTQLLLVADPGGRRRSALD